MSMTKGKYVAGEEYLIFSEPERSRLYVCCRFGLNVCLSTCRLKLTHLKENIDSSFALLCFYLEVVLLLFLEASKPIKSPTVRLFCLALEEHKNCRCALISTLVFIRKIHFV